MIRNLFLSLVWVLSSIVAFAQTGTRQTLFETAKGGVPHRIPALATTQDGHVLAFSDYRPCKADVGNGEVDILLRRSTEAGEAWDGSSWTASKTIANGNGKGGFNCGFGDAAVVADRESGEVLMMCVAGDVFYGKATTSKTTKVAKLVSKDNGATWSKPADVTSTFIGGSSVLKNGNIAAMFFASGRILQSRTVKVGNYYRIYGAVLARVGTKQWFWMNYSDQNFVVYSDDFGKTWNLLGSGACCPGGNEAKLEELEDGSIVLSSRKSGGRYFNIFKFSDLKSAKGNWGTAVASNEVSNGLSFGKNSCNGEFMLYKGVKDAKGNIKDILLQSVPTGSDRSHVSIFYKEINGSNYTPTTMAQGWTKGIQVSDKLSAYSAMTILPDGKIGFFFEEAPNEYCMVYLPLTVSEATNGAYSQVVETKPEGGDNGNTDNGGDNGNTDNGGDNGNTDNGGDNGNTDNGGDNGNTDNGGDNGNTDNGGDNGNTDNGGDNGNTDNGGDNGNTDNGGDNDNTDNGNGNEGGEEVVDPALTAALAQANEVYAITGVGYPSAQAASRKALKALIDQPTTAAEVNAAIAAFKNETSEIQMPESGKTYVFANVAKNGKKFYVHYSASGVSMSSKASATVYTCKLIDGATGEYAFVTPEGKYLIWKGPNGTEGFWLWAKTHGYNDNKGYLDSYESTYCDLVIEKLKKGGHVSAQSNADLFGMVAIKGMRYSRNEYGYFVITTNGTFDAGQTPYYDDSFSSAFMIEEVAATPANLYRGAIAVKAVEPEVEDMGGVTAVESVVAPVEDKNAPVYDMMGRRVTDLVKGRIYIKNGKKFMAR